MALPLSSIPRPVNLYATTLASRIESSDTSLTLESATDDAGNAISGVVGLTIDGEVMIGTKSGTSVTGLLRGIDPQDGTSEVSALKAAHQRGAVVKITDAPFLNIAYRLMNGTEGFPNLLSYSSALTPVSANDLARKGYVDAMAAGASYTNAKVVVAGNAGETVSAGQLLYFDTGSNNEWMKCDADTAGSVENVILGIAQGAGTDGNAINGGVLIFGLDENQSGLTAGDPQFASNTAGAISSSAGTTEVQIGAAKSTTSIYFCPRYSQQITEDQQDALAGTDGTPSASNLYITEKDAVRAPIYAATASGSDTYAITPDPALTAYANGQEFKVKLDVANTGPATLNVNGLGAISLVKGVSTALVTGDLLANQIITVKYNSTGPVFQVVDIPTQLVTGATLTDQHFHKKTFGVITRDLSAVSGGVTTAHSLGVAPKRIRITAKYGTTNGSTNESVGIYDGTSTATIYVADNGTHTTGNSTSNVAVIQTSAGNDQSAVATFDATNITLTWTKTGTPTGTAQILWEAEV